jgi:hypothetical protein
LPVNKGGLAIPVYASSIPVYASYFPVWTTREFYLQVIDFARSLFGPNGPNQNIPVHLPVRREISTGSVKSRVTGGGDWVRRHRCEIGGDEVGHGPACLDRRARLRFVVLATSALASRLRVSWMEARATRAPGSGVSRLPAELRRVDMGGEECRQSRRIAACHAAFGRDPGDARMAPCRGKARHIARRVGVMNEAEIEGGLGR